MTALSSREKYAHGVARKLQKQCEIKEKDENKKIIDFHLNLCTIENGKIISRAKNSLQLRLQAIFVSGIIESKDEG